MLDAQIKGTTTGNGAEVNASHQLLVQPETDVLTNAANVGAVKVFSENNGASQGTGLSLKSPETSLDYRLRVGMDNLFDYEVFNYAGQNTSKHKYNATNVVSAWASGYFTLNSTSVVFGTSGAMLNTYRHFPLYGAGTTYVETYMGISMAMVTNINIDAGLFLPNSTSSTVIPLEGIYFRSNSTGTFGVINNAGVETTTSPFSGFTMAANQIYKMTIAIGLGQVDFWIDDVLMGTIVKGTAAGGPIAEATLPWGVRHHHTGIPSAGLQTKVYGYAISVGDYAMNRPWRDTIVGMNHGSIQGHSGGTQGSTCNYANSAAPASASLSNSVAGYTTLGGQFQFAAVAGAETDYALFAYQLPAVSSLVSGRSLVITGVTIDTFNMGAAVATTPTLLQWSIGVDSTAASLAQGEGANAKARRVLPLGTQMLAIATPIGGNCDRQISRTFSTPLIVNPTGFVQIFLKMPVATNTGSQIIRGIVSVDGYWE